MKRFGTLSRPMLPTPLRLFLVVAASVALLAVAASGVFAAGDLSACSLVASEGADPNPLGIILEGVDAVDGQAWAVGGHVAGPVSDPVIWQWNGSWSDQKLQTPPGPIGISSFYSVKAFSPTDVWAVGSWMGQDALVEHWDGHAWSLVTVPSFGGAENILTGVDGTSSTDVWLVGQRQFDRQMHGVVLHGGTQGFQIVTPPDVAILHDVAMLNGEPLVEGWRIAGDGFAAPVIALGTTTGAWQEEQVPAEKGRNVFLTGIAVGTGGAAWAVGWSDNSPNGDTPVTYQRSANGWTTVAVPDQGGSTRLVSVASDPHGTVAVGALSTGGSSRAIALRATDGGWTAVPGAGSQPPDTLASVSLDGGDIWGVGRAVVVGATYGVPSARVYSCG